MRFQDVISSRWLNDIMQYCFNEKFSKHSGIDQILLDYPILYYFKETSSGSPINILKVRSWNNVLRMSSLPYKNSNYKV